MKRPFENKRVIGPLFKQSPTGGDTSDKEFYQEQFTQRMVSASNQGVQDPIEEIEYFESTIEDVPWGSFSDEQKVAIATPAMNSIRTVFETSVEQGKMSSSEAISVITKFSMILFNKTAGVESAGMIEDGMMLIKSRIKGDNP
jgi:hypothetical protein